MSDNIVNFQGPEDAGLRNNAKVSKTQKRSSARLCAVQVIYQMLTNKQDAKSALRDFFDYRMTEMITQEQIVEPDQGFLSAIVRGIEEHKASIDQVVFANLTKPDDIRKKNEKLLYSVFLCGVYELLMHHDLDIPVIINEYINVGHAFFDQGEVRLINGLLDSAARSIRS